MKKSILFITTGGTIEGIVAKNLKEGEEILSSEDFVKYLSTTIASIKNVHGIDVNITLNQMCQKDSSNIVPSDWIQICEIIKSEYDKYDGFIIAHGTNTLGYTTSAVSFAFPNIAKPVIFTGSQVPAGMPGSDAIMNLENALRLAAIDLDEYKYGSRSLMGVFAVFGSHIITGTRVKKDTEFDYDAFKSFSVGSIGRIGRIIDFDKINLQKHHSYLSSTSEDYYLAKTSEDLICENYFDYRIVSLTEFPGMDYKIFETLVNRLEVKGFILRAFGAGDASDDTLLPAFEYLKGREIPIVVTTQAPNGNSNFQVNDPGKKLKDDDLAIPAHDMSIEAITTKLAWLLAAKKNGKIRDYNDLKKKMTSDMRGEINVIREVKM